MKQFMRIKEFSKETGIPEYWIVLLSRGTDKDEYFRKISPEKKNSPYILDSGKVMERWEEGK